MMTKRMFFVHIPKTGGICFKINLMKFYDSERSLHVYTDDQFDNDLSKYDLVTGHIQPIRSDITDDRLLVTWIRNPVDRLISLFFYQKYYDESNSDSDKASHSKRPIFSYESEIERYVSDPENQNQISEDYFYHLSVNDFDFIGIYEDFNRQQREFFKDFFDHDLEIDFVTNINGMIEKTESNNYDINPDLRKYIEYLNKDDMKIYHSILEKKGFDRDS